MWRNPCGLPPQRRAASRRCREKPLGTSHNIGFTQFATGELREAARRYVQAYPNTPQIQEILIKMSNHRKQILETIENLVEARDIIFTQIVNLAMSGEMKHLESAFDLGDKYNFTLKHFESVQDVNVKKLVSLCKNAEETVFSLMNLNGISENEVNL